MRRCQVTAPVWRKLHAVCVCVLRNSVPLHTAFWKWLCCTVICVLSRWPCGLSSESVLGCCGALMCDGHGEEICAWLAYVLFFFLRRLVCSQLAKDWDCMNMNCVHELRTWTCLKMLEMMIVTFLGHLWRVLLHFSEKMPSDRPSLTKAAFSLCMCAV